MAHTLTALKVTDRPDAAFYRIDLEWTDEVGKRQATMFSGFTGKRIHEELEVATARSEDARHGYLLGLARGISIMERR